MQDRIRVLVLGTGQMGIGIARLLLQKPSLELVGAVARRTERDGMDLGRAIGLNRDLGIAIRTDLAAALAETRLQVAINLSAREFQDTRFLERVDEVLSRSGLDRDLGMAIRTDLRAVLAETRPHLAIQATCSRLAEAQYEVFTLVRQGVHVISIAEEMAYPACLDPDLASELRRLAQDRRVAVLGTGINPGFVLDLLIIALTGVCARVHSIHARRVNDLSPYGPSVLAAQGVGLSPEAFRQGLANGNVVGHIGFPQSIHMIAAALGWEIECIEEAREPIIARTTRETPSIHVEPGQVAGCLHKARAYCRGRPVIELSHPQQVHPELEDVQTGDFIEIRGTPDVRLAGSPEIPGGQATVALAVNAIPRLLAAPPGLYSMAELPVPAALPERDHG